MRSLSTRTAGLMVLVLGAWGGVVPFIGPYFHFTLGPTHSWTWTMGRLWLDILPAVAAVLGGLMLIGAGWRPRARLGALLALAGGIWFVIGPDISLLWTSSGAQGAAHGSLHIRVLEMLAYHTGLGVLIAALAAYALPRFPLVAGAVPAAAEATPAAAPRTRAPLFGRRRRVARDAALVGGGMAAGAAAEASAHRGAADRASVGTAADQAPTADRTPAAGRTPARAGAVPPADAPVPATDRPVTGLGAAPASAAASEAPGGPAPASAAASEGPAGGPATATGYAPGSGHTARRRRGGLLSVFSRR